MLGAVRRTLDFSGNRALLKARVVELRVRDAGRGPLRRQPDRRPLQPARGVPLARRDHRGHARGVRARRDAEPAVLPRRDPSLAAPASAFKVAYHRACADIRRSLEDLLDAAEEGPPQQEKPPPDRGDRPPGQIQGLKPIPRFAPKQRDA